MTNLGASLSAIFERCGITFLGRRANDNARPVTNLRKVSEGAAMLNAEMIELDERGRLQLLDRLLDESFRLSLERDALQKQLSTDKKTGLLTYEAFLEKVGEAIAKRERGEIKTFSVGMADVRGLKMANDTISHATGDNLIIGGAQCLQNSIRVNDACGRGGGGSDEFFILVEDAGAAQHPVIVSRVNENFSNLWVDAPGKDLQVRVDMVFGIVEAQPGQSPAEIVAGADALAMAAKAAEKDLDKQRETYKLMTRPKITDEPRPEHQVLLLV